MNGAALEFDATIEDAMQLEDLQTLTDHGFDAAIDAKRAGRHDDAFRLLEGSDFRQQESLLPRAACFT